MGCPLAGDKNFLSFNKIHSFQKTISSEEFIMVTKDEKGGHYYDRTNYK